MRASRMTPLRHALQGDALGVVQAVAFQQRRPIADCLAYAARLL